jgi:CHAD domain-containing protein
MSEAGRHLLHFHLQRMFYHEPGTRSGLNGESVHDMRVAVRRMTAALDVFGGAYKGKARRWMLRGLLALEGDLGGVRDFDVNIAQAETYLETLPDEARPDLEQLVANWRAERDSNQARLLRTLDSRKYADFADALKTFCETPGADLAGQSGDVAAPIIVAHAAPAIIYVRYEALRAYEPLIQDAPVEMLHELRAEAKRMRYTLESFRDVLGSEARDLIALFVRVQDHLGALQDADIASTLIQMYIKREVKRANKKAGDAGPVDVSTRLYGINAYLDSRQDQIESARKSFGPLWAEVISLETRQMIARAVGVL